MEIKKSIGWLPFAMIAVVLGVAVFKQLNFEDLSFKKPALGTVYLLSFILSVVLMLKGKKSNNQ